MLRDAQGAYKVRNLNHDRSYKDKVFQYGLHTTIGIPSELIGVFDSTHINETHSLDPAFPLGLGWMDSLPVCCSSEQPSLLEMKVLTL